MALLSCWSRPTELTISPQILGPLPANRWSVQFRLSLLGFLEDRSHVPLFSLSPHAGPVPRTECMLSESVHMTLRHFDLGS